MDSSRVTEPWLKMSPKYFISAFPKIFLQEPPLATTFSFKSLSSSSQPEMFFLFPLTPDIFSVALLRCLALFRLCFCYWQGSKIESFPLQRAKGLGVPLRYYFPNCLRVLLGRKRRDGITHLLYPVTEAALHSLGSVQHREATTEKGSRDALDYSRDTGQVW